MFWGWVPPYKCDVTKNHLGLSAPPINGVECPPPPKKKTLGLSGPPQINHQIPEQDTFYFSGQYSKY